MILGTPHYMSPEQCEGKGHVDARSDIYSLGVVMYELFTGQLPFNSPGVGEVMVAHMTSPTPRPTVVCPAVPAAVEAIILHAMEKNPARRFQSMEEMAQAVADPETHLLEYRQTPLAATVAQQAPTVHLSSTLSEAAAELVPRHPSILTVSLGTIAAIAMGAALLLAVALTRRPTVIREVATPPPPVSDRVQLTLVSDPAGATVEGDGVFLGTTPLLLQRPRSDATMALRLRLSGHLDVARTIGLETEREILVVMAKEPTPPPAPARKKVKPQTDGLLLRPTF
jgi:hypothetical protein